MKHSKYWMVLLVVSLPMTLWSCPGNGDDDDDDNGGSGSSSCFFSCQGAYGENHACDTDADALDDCETWAHDSCGEQDLLEWELAAGCGGCSSDCAPSWYGDQGDDDDDSYGDDDTYWDDDTY